MTFVSVCLAAFQLGAEIGAAVSVIAVPAFIRTVIRVSLGSRGGKQVTLYGRCEEMIFSLMLMVPVYCVGMIGFVLGLGAALVSLEAATIFAPLLGLATTGWAWAMTLRVSQIES